MNKPTNKIPRIIIGLTESVEIITPKKRKKVTARIDTGATMSSMDSKIAAALGLGPVVRTKTVKSATGTTVRPVIRANIKIKGKAIHAEFTLADRAHMKYGILIGQNILKEARFLIDPHK